MVRLSGIYPPIVTPFENQEVSYSQLTNNLKKWNEFDLSGYVILGSNGENVMLSDAESLSIIETAIKYIPDNKQIIIGAGSESSQRTVSYMKQVQRIGGDAFLIVSPSYYKDQMTDSVLQRYYSELAENSDLPGRSECCTRGIPCTWCRGAADTTCSAPPWWKAVSGAGSACSPCWSC